MKGGIVIEGDPHETIRELIQLLHVFLQINKVIVDTD